jgi:undecaprenyl-diphosphatase
VVAVHVATAVALMWFFRADWVRIVRGLATSIRDRQISTPDQRLGWLLVVATVPVGLAGLVLEHTVRTTLGKPVPAALFLILNGLILAGVERIRSKSRIAVPVPTGSGGVYAGSTAHQRGVSAGDGDVVADNRLAAQSWGQALLIGSAQVLALLPGVSRSGATIGAGLLRGLSHEDAARFAFLLATPVILAAGVLKLPELAGPAGHGILGPVLAGSLVAGLAAYGSLRFLTRYFETRTLNPFAIYCVVAGLGALVWTRLTRPVRSGLHRPGRPVRDRTRIHPRPHPRRPRIRPHPRQTIGGASVTDDHMLSMALHLHSQQLSLRDIAARLVINKRKEERTTPIARDGLAPAARARRSNPLGGGANERLIEAPAGAERTSVRALSVLMLRWIGAGWERSGCITFQDHPRRYDAFYGGHST